MISCSVPYSLRIHIIPRDHSQKRWMLLKPHTFRMSLPKVINNAFTISILRVPLNKTHNFYGFISGNDNDCQGFYTSQKHEISKKAQKSVGF